MTDEETELHRLRTLLASTKAKLDLAVGALGEIAYLEVQNCNGYSRCTHKFVSPEAVRVARATLDTLMKLPTSPKIPVDRVPPQ